MRHPHPPRIQLFLLFAALAAGASPALAFAVPSSSVSTSTSTGVGMSSSANAAAACATSSSSTSLGSDAMRKLVQRASIESRKQSLDLNGVAWLEHLNLVVGDMDTATKFYIEFLGFTAEREANPKSNHFNLGQQQFHLAATGSDDDPPQRVTGSIGLTVPNLERIRADVEDATVALEGTQFAVARNDSEHMMTVTCPWGNTIHLYDIRMDDEYQSTDAASQSSQKMVKMHGEGGVHGPHRMAVRGNPGIRYVEISCPMGTIGSIARFYEEMLGCDVTRTTARLDSTTSTVQEVAIVSVGPGVHLTFVENDSVTDDIANQMRGVHACIYVPDFQQKYDTLKERDLIWTNPRFTHLDSCDTWEEACASRTFRFKDVVDLETGEKVLELEHETRPMMHGQYMKVPPYVPN